MPLVLDNVTVTYRSLPAVHHVYARFDEGCSWAIYGPNGAGKSTLLKTIMRLMPCSTGEVRWEGLQRRDLAYLPQQSEMDRSLPMTVFELTALGLWHELGLFGGLHSRQAARVMQALERVGMAGFADRLPGALSGGQTTHQESLQTSVDAIFNCMTTVILRPDAFDAPDSQAQTEAFIAWCKQSPHDPDAPVLAPGEWEAANREARLAEGIPLDAGSWQAICAAARDVGLSESHITRCRPLA